MSAEYDIIIIGAGSAGCVLASQLALNSKLQILLIEAGGKNNSRWIKWPIGYGRNFTNPRVNWMQYSTPDGSLDGQPQYMPRGKGIGGSSAINAMVYTRGFKEDFDDWNSELWTGEIFWDAFEELENRHGDATVANGPLDVSRMVDQFHPLSAEFAKISMEVGLHEVDTVAPDHGYGDYRYTIHKGRRVSARTAFLDRAKKCDNLTIITGAEVSHVEFENGRAKRVRFLHRRKHKTVEARKLVVLSAGAYHTPKILMHSGIGDVKKLKNFGIECEYNNPNVGRNLQDHLGISYHYRANQRTLNSVFGRFWGRLKAGVQYLLTRKGPMSISVNQMGGFVISGPTKTRPDFQLYLNPLSFDRNEDNMRTRKYPPNEDGFILAFNSCRPKSKGSIELGSSDPFDDPIIKPNYLSEGADETDVLLGATIIKALENTNAFDAITKYPTGIDLLEASPAEIIDDFHARAGTVFHACGTAKMSPEARGGVVDEKLNVYGVNGLKVVDASIFPLIPSGNTNAPVIATAWIAAKRILNELS